MRSLKIVQQRPHRWNLLFWDEHRFELKCASDFKQRGNAQVGTMLDPRKIGAGNAKATGELGLAESEALSRSCEDSAEWHLAAPVPWAMLHGGNP